MYYEEVTSLLGYTGEMPPVENGSCSLDINDIFYGFEQTEEGNFRLVYIVVDELAADVSIFREIRIGDSIQSVFSKIPARDTELRQWAYQTLYGTDQYDTAGYAQLDYVAMSYYTINFVTPAGGIHLSVTRDGMQLYHVEMYGPELSAG